MTYHIKQVDHDNGDKSLKGVIPNMKVGDLRFYPQDNPNLYRRESRELSSKTTAVNFSF